LKEEGMRRETRLHYANHEILNVAGQFLSKQSGLLGVPMAAAHDDSTYQLLWWLLWAARESAWSVLVLGQHLYARDAMVAGRTVVETLVNACYLLAEGEPAVKRILEHNIQRQLRDIHKNVKLTETGFAISTPDYDEIKLDEKLRALMEEYGDSQGFSKAWTKKPLRARLQSVDRKFGTSVGGPLRVAYVLLYSNASEIAHGSLYGAVYASGATDGPWPEDVEDHINRVKVGDLSVLMLVLGSAIHSVLLAVTADYPVPEVVEASSKNLAEVDVDTLLGKVLDEYR
jgi:hypothetical protein